MYLLYKAAASLCLSVPCRYATHSQLKKNCPTPPHPRRFLGGQKISPGNVMNCPENQQMPRKLIHFLNPRWGVLEVKNLKHQGGARAKPGNQLVLHKVTRMTATPRSLNVESPDRTDLNQLFCSYWRSLWDKYFLPFPSRHLLYNFHHVSFAFLCFFPVPVCSLHYCLVPVPVRVFMFFPCSCSFPTLLSSSRPCTSFYVFSLFLFVPSIIV